MRGNIPPRMKETITKFGKLSYSVAALTAFVLQPASPAVLSAGVMGQPITYEARTSPGEMTLEVRPAWEERVLSFAIGANTHSVALSQIDLSDEVRLVAGDRSLEPDSAGRLRGHRTTDDRDWPRSQASCPSTRRA